MIMIPVMHSQFRKIPAIKLPTTMRTHMGKQLQRLLSIPAIPLFPGTPGRRNDFIQFIICRLNHRHLVIPTHACMDAGGRAKQEPEPMREFSISSFPRRRESSLTIYPTSYWRTPVSSQLNSRRRRHVSK